MKQGEARHSFFLKRFFIVLTLSTLVALALLFFLSVAISFTAFTRMNENEIQTYMDQGRELLAGYENGLYSAGELDDILNPKLGSDNNYMILLDEKGEIVAANRRGLVYFEEQDIPALKQALGKSEYFKLNIKTNSGDEVPNISAGTVVKEGDAVIGYVFAGKILYHFENALSQYRVNLLLMLFLVLALFLLPGYWLSKRLTEPARILKDAAMRLAGGNLNVRIDKKMKGEMGEIASAFNIMSERLSSTIAELSYQKQSIELTLEGLSEGVIAMDSRFEIVRENNAVTSLFKDRNTSGYRALCEAMKKNLLDGEEISGEIKERDTVLQYSIKQIKTGAPEQVIAVALVRDITENVRLEKTRHDYVANISHELRTPLSSMRGLIEGLRDGVVTRKEDQQRYYTILSGEVLRLSRLVDDLLELSGLQASTAAFEMEKINVREMMLDLHDRYKKMFEEEKKRFVLKLPDENPPDIISNEDRLTQVLTIFLDNAIKYTKPGGRVETGVRVDGAGVCFYVKDNGTGMDEQTVGKIYDRFYQAEVSRSDKGNGLGLAIAKEILDKLGVEIFVKSVPGDGSEFGFTVPTS